MGRENLNESRRVIYEGLIVRLLVFAPLFNTSEKQVFSHFALAMAAIVDHLDNIAIECQKVCF